jgi:hypothetical protein
MRRGISYFIAHHGRVCGRSSTQINEPELFIKFVSIGTLSQFAED